MAKYGKFVGKDFEVFNSMEIENLTNVIKRVFNDVGVVSLKRVDDTSPCSAIFEIVLNQKIEKKNDLTNPRNFAYGITKLTVMANKSSGRIEEGIGNYVGEPFVQYSLTAWTDGKYHEYKRQYKNDCKFEGKGHYAYDTELTCFLGDLAKWRMSVYNGIDR